MTRHPRSLANVNLLVAVLAAGASRRLGQPKQLAPVDGEPLLRGRCQVALAAGVGPVIAVLGCEAERCAAVIADLPVDVRRNDDWREGMAASLRHAAEAARVARADALLILTCDQYLVEANDLQAVRDAWVNSPAASYVTRWVTYVGPPAIIPADYFEALRHLHGDQGAKSVLYGPRRARPREIENPRAVADIDSPRDLAVARGVCP